MDFDDELNHLVEWDHELYHKRSQKFAGSFQLRFNFSHKFLSI